MWDPSIWANVEFSPMRRDQRLLLERGGEVRYVFPESLRYVDDVIRLGSGSEAFVVCGFHDQTGKIFSGLLLKAPELTPHKYLRLHDEFVLTAPKGRENRNQNQTLNTTATNSDSLFMPPADGPRSKRAQESLSMSKYGTEDLPSPMVETQWPYLLFYTVREGVLLYFANTQEECFEVIRVVANYGDVTDGNLNPLKYVVHPLGATATARRLIEVTNDDLKRHFLIKSSPEEQAKNTNCVVYCMRALMSLQLAIRGYDVRRACADHPKLGPVVGEAAAVAWEKVWKNVRA
jgi:hypothetical protein